MGYCYDSRGRLACDSCGNSGGVRKRTCPHKVTSSNHRWPNGQRGAISYCYPSALCDDCFKNHGGNRKVHANCKAGAAARQAEYDAEQARLDRGDHLVVSRYGSWHEAVPEGMVGACYASAGWSDHRRVLVPKEFHKVDWLEDLPAGVAVPWDSEAPITKEVRVA